MIGPTLLILGVAINVPTAPNPQPSPLPTTVFASQCYGMVIEKPLTDEEKDAIGKAFQKNAQHECNMLLKRGECASCVPLYFGNVLGGQ